MKLKNIIFISIFAIIALFLPVKSFGATSDGPKCGIIPQAVCDSIINPTTAVDSPTDPLMPLVNFIVNILVALFGSIILLIIIISAAQIAASGGNEDMVKKGKENIFKAVTGLVLLISFRAILTLINRLFEGVDTNILFANNPSGQLASKGIPLLISNAISLASWATGAISVIFVIVGGIQYTASAGGEGIKKAKKTITYALLGLVISIAAYGILVFIQSQLQK